MEKDDEIKGNGNSLDFGARIYDPRLGRWLSLDPLMSDFPDESPYTFAFNNPILLIDENGNEPNKAQSGSWTELSQIIIKHFGQNDITLEGLKYTSKAMGGGKRVGPFGSDKGKRYLYTEKMGWIDLGHFFQVAAEAKVQIGDGAKKLGARADQLLGDDIENASNGYGSQKLWEKTAEVEKKQTGATVWSYEDAPSNYAGYDFYLNYYTDDEHLMEALEEYFGDIGATDPENAPNWEVMQSGPQAERYFEQNKSFAPLNKPKLTEYGKEHQGENEAAPEYIDDTENSH